MSLRKALILGSLLIVVTAAGVAGLVAASSGELRVDEYPKPPFQPVDKDFPRILGSGNAPKKDDTAAYEAWQADRKRSHEFTYKLGTLSRATADEKQAVDLAWDEKYVEARQLAMQILKTNIESAPALYTLAYVEFFGDGNLPRALFLFRRLRHLLEKKGRDNPADADSREWWLRTIYLECDVLGDMDRREEQVRAVEALEAVYGPMAWLKTWSLIKLARYGEARQAIETTLADPRHRARGFNNLSALEGELHNRQAGYDVCKAMVQEHNAGPVMWSNFGLSCLSVFRFDEAEQAYLKSATMGKPDFSGSSYTYLSPLYLQEGRVSEALDALKKAKLQRADRDVYTMQQDRATYERSLALLMLALGHDDEALELARRIDSRPDRTGSSTDTPEIRTLTQGFFYWTVLSSHREQLAEQAAAETGSTGWLPTVDEKALDTEMWTLSHRLTKLLAGERGVNVLRPNYPNGPAIETWYLGSVIRILPHGVAAEAIRQARAVEDHPDAVAYFDAIEAEAALMAGHDHDALRLARLALEKLPAEGEKLLRARTSVVAGAAARRLGQTSECLKLWDAALRDFPQAFRLLGIRIPVAIQDDGSSATQLVAQHLLASPRFEADSAGFPVKLTLSGEQVIIEMFRLEKTRHFEAAVKVEKEDTATAAAAVKRFHERFMSPMMDLTQKDISSLDGSPSAVQSRKHVDNLLGSVKPNP